MIPCIMLGCMMCNDCEQVTTDQNGEIGVKVLARDVEKFYREHRRDSLEVDGLRCELFHITISIGYV